MRLREKLMRPLSGGLRTRIRIRIRMRELQGFFPDIWPIQPGPSVKPSLVLAIG